MPVTAETVQIAIDQALMLDSDRQVLPIRPATRVYKVLEVPLQRESIDRHAR